MSRQKDKPGTIKKCRGCERPMVWSVTEKGKNLPLDADPSRDGTFFTFIKDGVLEAVHIKSKSTRAEMARQTNQNRRTPHFVNCPDSSQFRKRA